MSTNSDRLRRITYKSLYGAGILIWRDDVLVAHELPDSPAAVAAFPEPARVSPSAHASSCHLEPEIPRTPAEKKLVHQLEDYFSGKKTVFDLTLISLERSRWTPFQARVAEALAAVPYGTTVTYGELAGLAGHPGAYRAVGSCMAANPYPVIIPCHRVVKSDGSLGNFAAGVEWKLRLLGIEGLPFPGMG
ncbi:MAG: methylated-DNA--[protein]-cysteine S-methyltransferase [Thermoleophilia bacterium]